MRTRFLPISFGVVFALTLFIAVAAGAQEERTDTESVGVQVLEVQQQQVPDNQQQAVEVQQQQVLDNQGQAVAVQQQQIRVQSHRGCPGAHTERTVRDPTRNFHGQFNIEGDAVRITYEIIDPPDPGDELSIELRDEDGDIVESITVDDDTNGPESVRVETDPGRHELEVEADAGLNYSVKLDDCTNAEANHNDGGDGDGGGGDNDSNNNNDSTDTNTDTTTTDTTTTDTTTTDTDTTTTGETTTSDTVTDALGETTTANNPDSVREADAFRCEFFLRAVRDDRGALRDQYRDDEVTVQRFEQCLSEDVLADTIPDRNLPFTGGMPLLFLAAIGLAAIAAGTSVLRVVTRRER